MYILNGYNSVKKSVTNWLCKVYSYTWNINLTFCFKNKWCALYTSALDVHSPWSNVFKVENFLYMYKALLSLDVYKGLIYGTPSLPYSIKI